MSKQGKLATKGDIADFVRETHFDEKLKNINKIVKSKHVLVEKKLNKLSGKVKLISTELLTKDLINEYSILNGAENLIEDGLKNYFIFQPLFR